MSDEVIRLRGVGIKRGGSMLLRDVTWTVYANPTTYVPPGWAEWSFGTWTPWWMHWDTPYEQPVAYQPYVRDFQAGGQITSEPDRYTNAWFDK